MKKEMKRKKSKIVKRNPAKLTKLILILIGVLLITFFVLLLIQYQIFSSIEGIFKKPKLINVRDECSFIFNKYIHQIKSEEDCKIRCKNECELNGKTFNNINFISKSDSCNECNCYCK